MSKLNTFAALTVTAAAISLASNANADVIEDFEGGSNNGAWTWGFGDGIPSSGGNPGAFLRTNGLDTFAPRLRTQATTSDYTGDYRSAGVTAMDADFITMQQSTTGGRPMTLMLIHDNNTPGNPTDDTAAYYMAENIPNFGEGWLAYHYDIPASETTLPTGWLLLNLGDSGSPAIHTWDQVIQDVSQVQFHYGDPTFFFIFQQWSLGVDNITLTTDIGTPCSADTNTDGVVNVTDLVEVILQWDTNDAAADINDDGIVNVQDLLEVILQWGVC